ncbi:MAG: hypothetical protein ACM3PP_01990 [Candidatus Saccharibacteria bacterium]
MQKEYRVSIAKLVFMVVVSVILMWGVLYEIDYSQNLFRIGLFFVSACCGIFAVVHESIARYVVNDDAIVWTVSNIKRPKKIDWKDIQSVKVLPFLFISLYTITSVDPNADPIRMSGVEGYKSLLAEIVARAPNAEISESIRKLAAK